MLVKTSNTVLNNIINAALEDSLSVGKESINMPSGDFFYDPWIIKPEYNGTSWETLLNALPNNIGEARIIVMESPSCYTRHTDIDDRYHLNLSGDDSYLINLQNNDMHRLSCDGIWYEMDAGLPHTAINIGKHNRVQLVVRKLLTRNALNDSVSVSITAGGPNPRYNFDNTLSVWLNRAVKTNIVDNFKQTEAGVCFDVERNNISELKNIIPREFKIETNL